MKKIVLKIIMISMVMMTFCVLPTQASSVLLKDREIEKLNRESSFLANGGDKSISMVYGVARGSIISSATIALTNEGEGEISIIIETLAQKKVDEIRHAAILEQQDGDNWVELARYEFDALKEEYPDQDLSGLTNEFHVKTLEVNQYYRVRGIHYVWLSGKAQGFSTQTDAMLLKKYPG